MELSFPTRKLKGSIKRINTKVSKLNINPLDYKVYGVSKTEGVTITGKEIGKNLTSYLFFEGQKFAYNPYRVNIGSLGLSDPDFKGLISPAYVIFETKKDINDEFLLHYLKSTLGLNLIRWYGDRGGVRSALRFQDLGKIDIPDLTYEQQTKAIEYLKKVQDSSVPLMNEFNSQLGNVKNLRRFILQEAVQGKLTESWRANNPNTEPASELLKHIEAEKQQLIAEKKIKKEKPLPAIEDDEIPYELPHGWVWCRFQEIFDIRDGTHDSPKDSLDKVTYPLVTSKNFNNGDINFDSARRISEEDYLKVIQRSRVHKGDILFSMIGGNIGNQVEVGDFTEYAIKNVALFKHYRYGLPAEGFLKVFSKYIAMSLQSEAAGGAQPFVSLKFFRNLIIGLPPIEEQQAIVEKVNSLIALCDELEQKIETSHIQVEQLMQSCLKEVFEQA